MSPKLSSDKRLSYERDGILFPIDVLCPSEVARTRTGLEQIESNLGRRPKTEELHQLFLNYRWAYDLVTHPNVLDAVESVLGPNILLWATSVFAKQPHDPGFISWHQDATYWGLDSGKVTTAWIALTESSTENGCMRVVKESHKLAIQPHTETYAEDNLLSRGQEIAVEVAEEEATDVVLAPGQLSLHHVNIVHGSKANSSDTPRIGFVARYITPSVSQSGFQQPVILARGEDRHGHFQHMKRPPESTDASATLKKHLVTAREHATGIRETTGAFEEAEN